MKKVIAFFLVSPIWWLVLTSTTIGAAGAPAPATATPTLAPNVAPDYKGPKDLVVKDGKEQKINYPWPISIHDPDNNLKEVKLEVKNGTLSVTGKATITGPSTNLMTLSGTELDINETLKTLTYKNNPDFKVGVDHLIVNAGDDAGKMMEKMTVPITVTQENAASKVCDRTKKASGGVEKWLGNWAAGPTLSYSLVQYNLADKKSSLNATAAGAGISFRYYSDAQLANFGESIGRPRYSLTQEGLQGGELTENTPPPGENQKWAESTQLTDVPSGCRATTYEFGAEEKIHSWVSISPTIYAFQEKNADNFAVQFAVNLGFFDDIFTIGAGWNLSGDNAGEWFILAGPSIGFGF